MTENIPDTQTNPKGFVYFDSNVISYIAHSYLENPIPTIIENGGIPVVSEVVLQELRSGSPNGELEFIQQHDFMFASAHEALFLDGRITFYTRPVEDDGLKETEFLEEFLRQFMRSISGSTSVPNLTSLMLDSLGAILNEVTGELSSEADPRTLASWNESKTKISNGFNELHSLPNPLILNAEIDKMKNFSKVIGNLKPLGIIAQMISLPILTDMEFLKDLVRPFTTNENMKERIQILCMTLVAMGFARDKKLAKNDEVKSVAAAKSQFSDAYHIAAAASCTLFLTADKRCAKLAYAIYEALGFNIQVCFVTQGKSTTPYRTVGANFWP